MENAYKFAFIASVFVILSVSLAVFVSAMKAEPKGPYDLGYNCWLTSKVKTLGQTCQEYCQWQSETRNWGWKETADCNNGANGQPHVGGVL